MTTDSKKVKPVFLSKDDAYLFAEGTHYDIYQKLGAHISTQNGEEGVFFATWAPHAKNVYVVGSFNEWDETDAKMDKMNEGGIYTLFIPGVKEGDMYKFLIISKDERKLYKADPYANYAQKRPETASVVYDIAKIKWTDEKWIKLREKTDLNKKPMAIYECHIGSWMRHPCSENDGFYTYREFADRIIPYLKDMHYSHLELMGIAEYPYDGSWGYQVTGYYAPTSRYGTPEDFAYLVNACHENKIGVILDWVPAHFPRDAHGLAEFDGECLYENPDPRLGEHPDWGTKIFDYSKNEVKNFLIANALFWVKEYHTDGLRVDAVASMLYLDYGKKEGEWRPNKYGENKNLDAMELFRHLNSIICKTYPGIMTIAEESTAWPKVTGRMDEGGLGFTFKWNMGWMHDFCEYMKLDPLYRKGHHSEMTFAMTYNTTENYILPLSHDEVVHLKCSLLNKMPGYVWDKFANLRAGYTYMIGHSGKKLLFMGQEFGQEREWSEDRELDWFLLEDSMHVELKNYVRELLSLYQQYPALYEIDNSWDGFCWLNSNDKDRSVYSFYRKASDGKNNILFVINLTPIRWKAYQVGVPSKKRYKLLLNSDEKKFGGKGHKVPNVLETIDQPCNDQKQSIIFDLPAYGAEIFLF